MHGIPLKKSLFFYEILYYNIGNQFFSKTDPETIPKVLHNMVMMLQDKCVSVQKKAIQVAGKLFKYTLMWLSKSKTVTDEMESAWISINELKKHILMLIDSDLDGYKINAIKPKCS